MERAPGFWIYGLDTWYRQWMDRLDNPRPRWLRVPARPVEWLLHLATGVTIMLILRHAQGSYSDGWASERMKWMLPQAVPQGGGEVAIRGVVPAGRAWKGQTLTVIAAGRRVGLWPVASGDFEIRFRLPEEDVTPAMPVHLEVRASRYGRPRWFSELSRRRLAYKLSSVEWVQPRTAHSERSPG
jgi:hypothetical protein